VEAMADLRVQVFKSFMEKDEAKKAELTEVLKKETFPKYLGKFNEILEKNGSYFVSRNPTGQKWRYLNNWFI
jgi:hypothetical protein